MNRKLVCLSFCAVSALAAACAPSAPPPAAPSEPALNAPRPSPRERRARGFTEGLRGRRTPRPSAISTRRTRSPSPNNQPSLKGRDAIVASLKGMFEQVTVKTVLTAEDTKTLGNVGVDTGRYAVTVTPKGRRDPLHERGPLTWWSTSRTPTASGASGATWTTRSGARGRRRGRRGCREGQVGAAP